MMSSVMCIFARDILGVVAAIVVAGADEGQPLPQGEEGMGHWMCHHDMVNIFGDISESNNHGK